MTRLGTPRNSNPGTLSRRTPPYVITLATSSHYVVIIPICRTRPDSVADVHLLCLDVAPIVRRRHTIVSVRSVLTTIIISATVTTRLVTATHAHTRAVRVLAAGAWRA